MEPNYIDVKERINRIVIRLAIELEKSYDNEEAVKEYLAKYECKNIKELIYLFLCETKPSDLNISLNMRQKIKNISDEVNQSETDFDYLKLNYDKLVNELSFLKEKIKSDEELMQVYYKKTEELTQINNNLTAQLKAKSFSKGL